MKSRGLSQVEIAHELQVQEMDSTFYNRFYSKVTKGTFIGMTRLSSILIAVFLIGIATYF
jgi:hypothetical protein